MNVSDKSPVETHAFRLTESLRSRSTFQVVLECLIYGSISSTALFGNIFVLYVVYKSRRLRNVTGLFVVSLAMSDIALATLVAPQSFAALIAGRWTSGFIACQLQGFVILFTVAVSLHTMALMSIDRYFRVVRPMKHRSFFTLPRACFMVASIWLFCLIYPIPYLASGRTYIFHPGKFLCLKEPELTFRADFVYISLCISLAVLSFCYLNVFRHLRLNAKRVKNMRGASAANDDNRRNISTEEIRLLRTLFVTVLGYLVCWTPVLIVDFIEKGAGYWLLSRGVYFFYTNIGLTSSSLSPIIYGGLNRTFRREYKKIFRFKKLSNQDEC